jgi:hypothetical protein
MQKDMRFRASVGYNVILKGAIVKATQNYTYKQYEPQKSYIAKGWNCFGNSIVNNKGVNVLLESGLNKIKSSMVAPIIVKSQICGMITLV